MFFSFNQRVVAKNALCLLIIVILLNFSSNDLQISKEEEIDTLLKSACRESNNFNFNTGILYSKKALRLSLLNSYKIGIIKSNYQIAYDFCNLGNYDKSFDYIKIIERDFPAYIQGNFQFHIRLSDLKGRNFLAQGFKNQAKDEFRKEFFLSNNYKKSEEIYRGKIHAYTQLSASCDLDSSYIYLKKILLLRNKVSSQEDFYFTYINLSDYFIEKNIYLDDSATFYNNEALRLGISTKSKFQYVGIIQRADILFHQRNYKESIKYTFWALKLSKDRNRSEQILASYKLLSNNYKELGDYELQSKFLDKYSKMKDSIFNARQNGVQASADIIFADMVKDDKSYNRLVLFFILFIVLFLAIIISIIFYKKYKKAIITKENQQPTTVDIKLQSASYEEIISLAKSNSAEFLFYFKEAYPVFCDKLLVLNPRLKNSELIFCAYLKLQFSTKEIASFTFVTSKAIQNRKNRIRKKLNIPSDVDINIWINEL
ncbi:hypothetical protein SAMN05421857_3179 [Chryseobacterium formosense]|uniref:hypothetical protein n=1 Tax=Chryseobacterium formosense TaxID=236814 RepID=UPI0008E55243|nr:hypothetical protein [Chryseobacterium formosense]SFT76642.1 hypothetical protein SAMN05421857_3179 [Chryseobacterium formosense]